MKECNIYIATKSQVADFVIKHDWKWASSCSIFENLIYDDKYLTSWDWLTLLQHNLLSEPENLLEKLFELTLLDVKADDTWKVICKYQRVSESFLRKHFDDCDAYIMINDYYEPLSNPLLSRVLTSLSSRERISYASVIIKKQNLSEKQLLKYWDELTCFGGNRSLIYEYQQLSDSLLDYFWDKGELDIDVICQYQTLSKEFMTKHWNQLNEPMLISHQTFDDDVLAKFNGLQINLYSRYHELSEELIEKFIHEINWRGISEKSDLSIEFMRKHFYSLDKNAICKYQSLNEDFLRDYWDKFTEEQIQIISKDQDLTDDFIRDYQFELSMADVLHLKRHGFFVSVSDNSPFVCPICEHQNVYRAVKQMKNGLRYVCSLGHEHIETL